MDSGATQTFARNKSIWLLRSSKIKPVKESGRKVLVTNKQIEIIRHTSMTPINLGEKAIFVETLWMPLLSEDFIIGIDFLREDDIVVDFLKQVLTGIVETNPRKCVRLLLLRRYTI